MKYESLEEDYSGEDTISYQFYFLDNIADLGNFISEVKPHNIDLNKIPVKKWFLYFRDDTGDYPYDSITLLDEYIKDQIDTLLHIANRIDRMKTILNK